MLKKEYEDCYIGDKKITYSVVYEIKFPFVGFVPVSKKVHDVYMDFIEKFTWL